MNTVNIYDTIRAQGGRMTKVRKETVRILLEASCLLSQTDILAHLRKHKLYPNRSTIFRELMFLAKNHITIKNTISGVDYYEIPQNHHHHLVCVGCNSISMVEIGNHLEKQEKQIAKQNKFNIFNHSLEFYGVCRKCQA